MTDVILVINAGSSSIKFSIYSGPFGPDTRLNLLYHGEIEISSEPPCLTISNDQHQQILKKIIPSKETEAGLRAFFTWFDSLQDVILKAVGHRIVHGGPYFFQPALITDEVMEKIAILTPLAPHHQTKNLDAIKMIKERDQTTPQVACFDTTFHQTQDKLATLFAIPRPLMNEGLVRYGFHGISYEYIASVINQYMGDIGSRRVIIAHLGSGASMCAMRQHKSVATSMGLTTLDGLMMGTRCGSIDPGALLYLLQDKKWSIEQVSTLLYKESGLLGVSGISGDMRVLQLSVDPNAIEAVDLFCFIAARELAALCGILQGCDAIIFTAGMGEKSALVRNKICDRLKWLGVILDEEANACNASIISQSTSAIVVGVIPTNEESMIAKHTIASLLISASRH